MAKRPTVTTMEIGILCAKDGTCGRDMPLPAAQISPPQRTRKRDRELELSTMVALQTFQILEYGNHVGTLSPDLSQVATQVEEVEHEEELLDVV